MSTAQISVINPKVGLPAFCTPHVWRGKKIPAAPL